MNINTLSVIDWAKKELKNNNLNYELLFDKPYSSLFKLTDEKRTYYLKVNPPNYASEPQVLNYLSGISNNILKVDAWNNDLNCFLSLNFDSLSADEYLLKNNNEVIILSIINEFCRIQQSVKVNELKEIGIRDISTIGIVDNFFKHVQTSSFNSYIDELSKIKNKISNDVQLLLNNGIQDSIEHGDFHLGNILINDKKEFVFIDLAEATIANPLFSLIAFVYSLERKLKITRDSKIIDNVVQDYLLSYGKFLEISHEKILNSFMLSEKLFDLYYVITIIQLLRTDPTSEKWSWRIKFHIEKIISTYTD